jgi:hypothetical protein
VLTIYLQYILSSSSNIFFPPLQPISYGSIVASCRPCRGGFSNFKNTTTSLKSSREEFGRTRLICLLPATTPRLMQRQKRFSSPLASAQRTACRQRRGMPRYSDLPDIPPTTPGCLPRQHSQSGSCFRMHLFIPPPALKENHHCDDDATRIHQHCQKARGALGHIHGVLVSPRAFPLLHRAVRKHGSDEERQQGISPSFILCKEYTTVSHCCSSTARRSFTSS